MWTYPVSHRFRNNLRSYLLVSNLNLVISPLTLSHNKTKHRIDAAWKMNKSKMLATLADKPGSWFKFDFGNKMFDDREIC